MGCQYKEGATKQLNFNKEEKEEDVKSLKFIHKEHILQFISSSHDE